MKMLLKNVGVKNPDKNHYKWMRKKKCWNLKKSLNKKMEMKIFNGHKYDGIIIVNDE